MNELVVAPVKIAADITMRPRSGIQSCGALDLKSGPRFHETLYQHIEINEFDLSVHCFSAATGTYDQVPPTSFRIEGAAVGFRPIRLLRVDAGSGTKRHFPDDESGDRRSTQSSRMPPVTGAFGRCSATHSNGAPPRIDSSATHSWRPKRRMISPSVAAASVNKTPS